jgi:small neutral amino acid transporter SnatA (MarC family)
MRNSGGWHVSLYYALLLSFFFLLFGTVLLRFFDVSWHGAVVGR